MVFGLKKKGLLIRSGGFSLPGVMVTTGILSAIAIGVIQFIHQTRKSAKTVEASLEVNLLHDQVLLFLKNQSNCRATFGGIIFGNAEKISLKRAVDREGNPDPAFKGINREDAPVRLLGIKIFDPTNPEVDKVPDIARMQPLPTFPEQDGWWAVVRFRYAKYQTASDNKKIFGGDTVDIYGQMKFDNFDAGQYTTNPELCEAIGDYTIAGKGKNYSLKGPDGTTKTHWIGPCLNGDPSLAIKDCVLR